MVRKSRVYQILNHLFNKTVKNLNHTLTTRELIPKQPMFLNKVSTQAKPRSHIRAQESNNSLASNLVSKCKKLLFIV